MGNRFSKIEKASLLLETVKQAVPFKEPPVKYTVRTIRQGVISFEKIAHDEMTKRGVRSAQAQMVIEEISDSIRTWLSLGHAVNIAHIGTLRPVVNACSHDRKEDCSPSDVKCVKLRFYPSGEMQAMLKDCSLQMKK